MTVMAGTTRNREAKSHIYRAITKHMQADVSKAAWQMLNTFLPYFALWGLMILTLRAGIPYWVTLLLAIPAAGLHIRIFIFFHDCVHGSFFDSQRANRILGYVSGILTFTPFEQWRRSHAIHHATVGDLDRRGTGDVWTLTVEEYQALPKWKRGVYRAYRNPVLMFIIGPVLIFTIGHRIPHRGSRRIDKFSVLFTDLALVALIGVANLAKDVILRGLDPEPEEARDDRDGRYHPKPRGQVPHLSGDNETYAGRCVKGGLANA